MAKRVTQGNNNKTEPILEAMDCVRIGKESKYVEYNKDWVKFEFRGKKYQLTIKEL